MDILDFGVFSAFAALAAYLEASRVRPSPPALPAIMAFVLSPGVARRPTPRRDALSDRQTPLAAFRVARCTWLSRRAARPDGLEEVEERSASASTQNKSSASGDVQLDVESNQPAGEFDDDDDDLDGVGDDWVLDSDSDSTVKAEASEKHANLADSTDDADDEDDAVGEDWILDEEEISAADDASDVRGGSVASDDSVDPAYEVERVQLYIEQPTLVALAGFVATGNAEEVVALFERLPLELRGLAMEVLLQGTVFLGFPRVLAIGQALAAADLVPIDLVLEDSQAADNASKAGLGHFDSAYSGGVRKMRLKLESYHPDLHKWMLEFVHGRVMLREGLRMKDREIVAAVMCIGQDTAPVLAAHIRSARRMGATRQEIIEVIDQCEEYFGRDRTQLAHGLFGLMEKNFNLSA